MAYQFVGNGPHVLILGGVHGDEIEGVFLADLILNELIKAYPFKLNLTIVPRFNPDGVLLKTRQNHSGIDLNRNLPSKDWTNKVDNPRYFPGPHACSEPENKALVSWIKNTPPIFIYSLHSWKPLLNVNGNCGEVAQTINKFTGYSIEESIGYPTPGCLGTYTGLEMGIPTLTYEIERGIDLNKIKSIHLNAMIESLKALESYN